MTLVLCAALLTAAAGTGETKALSADECAALRFLDFVTAPMSAADEKTWWDIGGRQFGLFSKRYNIAFAGYAAAALGQRGDEEERKTVTRILANCIVRYLKRDVWAYSQSKKYWGAQTWAPDPCYRENVMYTGHLLQLLALYERFTGNDRYWKDGFDFEWKDGKKVHYDVAKLIRVTVEQMRTNKVPGVTCEPGLLFFPCNNHPHYACRLFAAMGHGDWSADADRWETWALDHFLSPLFGGGAINLVYHMRSGIFFPRGDPALDGWSLLWYEAWAKDRRTAVDLWRKAAEKIDWQKFETGSDAAVKDSCIDPGAVPVTVTAVFLAAAARACDDPATAERLERIVDTRFAVRKGGRFYLDLNREWRIGASAYRIISLAESNGSRFRNLHLNALHLRKRQIPIRYAGERAK